MSEEYRKCDNASSECDSDCSEAIQHILDKEKKLAIISSKIRKQQQDLQLRRDIHRSLKTINNSWKTVMNSLENDDGESEGQPSHENMFIRAPGNRYPSACVTKKPLSLKALRHSWKTVADIMDSSSAANEKLTIPKCVCKRDPCKCKIKKRQHQTTHKTDVACQQDSDAESNGHSAVKAKCKKYSCKIRKQLQKLQEREQSLQELKKAARQTTNEDDSKKPNDLYVININLFDN